jgi:hypothetical protein
MEPPKGIVGTSQEAEKAWRPITFRTFLRCNAVPRRVFVRGQLSGWSSPLVPHPAFSDAVTRARAARVDALETRMLSANNGGTAATSIFALKNADPDEWREVRYANIEHSVTN